MSKRPAPEEAAADAAAAATPPAAKRVRTVKSPASRAQHIIEALPEHVKCIAGQTGVGLVEFQRFLHLKMLTRDSDGTKISPTPLMDAIWRACILDTKFYTKLQKLAHLELHYSPASASEDADATAERGQRLEQMTVLYRMEFNGEKPVEVEADEEDEDEEEDAPIYYDLTVSHEKLKAKGAFLIVITCHSDHRSMRRVYVFPSTRIAQLQSYIKRRHFRKCNTLKLLNAADRVLPPNWTIDECRVEEGSVLQLKVEEQDEEEVTDDEDEDKEFTIFIWPRNETSMRFTVSPDDTVISLKRKYADMTNTLPSRSRLFLACIPLPDYQTLRQCGVTDQCGLLHELDP